MGSTDRLVWSSADAKTLFVWNRTTNKVLKFALDPTDQHAFQFMQLSGRYMSWFASQTNSVMDLDSGAMYDLGLATSVVAGDDLMGAARSEKVRTGQQTRLGPARLILKPAKAWFADTRCGTSSTT